jgi:predicted nuclease of predicted toxin-antitoxin system
MVRFLADENFNNQIVRGVLRQSPDIDIVRIQDVGLSGADDPTVLVWAAQEGQIVLTHDVATMTTFAYQRIQAELSMPGLFEVSRRVLVGVAIEEIILIAECSIEGEWEGQVRFLPLR